MAGIVVKPRARILHGHDWVFSSEVLKVFGNPTDGDVISLKDGKDRLIGSAIYNSRSQIVARRFSRRRQDLDLEFSDQKDMAMSDVRERHANRHHQAPQEAKGSGNTKKKLHPISEGRPQQDLGSLGQKKQGQGITSKQAGESAPTAGAAEPVPRQRLLKGVMNGAGWKSMNAR